MSGSAAAQFAADLRIPYPTGWLLAVADSDAIATRGAALLAARASDVRELRAAGNGIFDLRRPSRLEGFINVLRHLNTDQASDLVVYERARRAGRVVLAARGLNADARRDVAAELRTAGLHFVNFYGGVATEDWDGWRGEPLAEVPGWAWR